MKLAQLSQTILFLRPSQQPAYPCHGTSTSIKTRCWNSAITGCRRVVWKLGLCRFCASGEQSLQELESRNAPERSGNKAQYRGEGKPEGSRGRSGVREDCAEERRRFCCLGQRRVETFRGLL
eukprot:symbB.v1.2.033209.t1/scaffold4089.1/size46570/2